MKTKTKTENINVVLDVLKQYDENKMLVKENTEITSKIAKMSDANEIMAVRQRFSVLKDMEMRDINTDDVNIKSAREFFNALKKDSNRNILAKVVINFIKNMRTDNQFGQDEVYNILSYELKSKIENQNTIKAAIKQSLYGAYHVGLIDKLEANTFVAL
jgi:hypothetical protein